MKLNRLLIPCLLLAPALAFGASKEMIELQRDIAQLQDAIRLLQQSVDSKTATIQTLSQQSLDAASGARASVAELNRSLQAGNMDLGRQVAQPIAAMNNRIDGLGQDMQNLQQTSAEQNAKMAKIQQQLIDLLNAVKAMQSPAAAPPPATDAAGGTAPAAGGPPISATDLFQNAVRDMNGGNSDLALGEFTDYVKYYRDTEYAPTAQFNIGQIHFFAKKYDLAVADFDQVLEAFPVNPKTAEAHYMKGRSLNYLGQRNDAVKEFRSCIAQFPTSSVAGMCKQALGNPPAPATGAKKPVKRDN
jgi:TolA-binding protein